MPRLSPSFLHHARRIHSLLPLLLRTCRDLPSATNELRWLQEHVLASRSSLQSSALSRRRKRHLYQLCLERSRGRPLQYILGNQPFGGVDIICRPGVLIPRTETETYTTHVASLIIAALKTCTANRTTALGEPRRFRILDLCTGSGCISILLHAILSAHLPNLEVLGVDISPEAIRIAKQNLRHNVVQANLSPVAQEQIHFICGDIFGDVDIFQGEWDLVISNPPYISPHDFGTSTSRSVRNHEPRIALVSQRINACSNSIVGVSGRDSVTGDGFYPRLLEIAESLRAKIIVAEVGGIEQAQRVASLTAESSQWNNREIWRDWPGSEISSESIVGGAPIKIKGEGNGRSVFAARDDLIDIMRNFLSR